MMQQKCTVLGQNVKHDFGRKIPKVETKRATGAGLRRSGADAPSSARDCIMRENYGRSKEPCLETMCVQNGNFCATAAEPGPRQTETVRAGISGQGSAARGKDGAVCLAITGCEWHCCGGQITGLTGRTAHRIAGREHGKGGKSGLGGHHGNQYIPNGNGCQIKVKLEEKECREALNP